MTKKRKRKDHSLKHGWMNLEIESNMAQLNGNKFQFRKLSGQNETQNF